MYLAGSLSAGTPCVNGGGPAGRIDRAERPRYGKDPMAHSAHRKESAMTPDQIFGELEGLVSRLGIEVRDAVLEEDAGGGLCLLNGKRVMILDQRLNRDRKNGLLLEALKNMNLEAVYIKPYIRQLIENAR